MCWWRICHIFTPQRDFTTVSPPRPPVAVSGVTSHKHSAAYSNNPIQIHHQRKQLEYRFMAGRIRANPTKNRAMRYNAKEHLMDVYDI